MQQSIIRWQWNDSVEEGRIRKWKLLQFSKSENIFLLLLLAPLLCAFGCSVPSFVEQNTMAELHAASNESSSGDNVVLVSDIAVGAEGNGELKEDKQAGEVNSEQKDTTTETRDYSKDIYGRVPGK